jgi:pimeloyl-ACP methyl ester carboxylesterase
VRASEEELGDVPTTVYRPGRGRGPWPTVLVVPGATRRGRRHPAFVGIGRGLAAAGVLTAVAEPPGLTVGELTPRTLADTEAAAEALCLRTDVRDGRVALAGVSGGGTLVLLLAGAPGLAERVSVVAALAPLCDVRAALRLVTTDRYVRDGELVPFETGSFFRLVIARSAIAWLEDGPDRRVLRDHVLGLADYGEEPLRAFWSWPSEQLGAEARGVIGLLGNIDPARFDALYGTLTDAQLEAAELLSPIHTATGIIAPVELVVARADKYIPLEDAAAFARECPRARVTVIESLEHAVPSVSLAAARDLARLDRAAVRFLAAACSPSYSA